MRMHAPILNDPDKRIVHTNGKNKNITHTPMGKMKEFLRRGYLNASDWLENNGALPSRVLNTSN